MLRIGGTASPGHITVFRGLKTHFQQQGIELDWVLYSNYDALVEAFEFDVGKGSLRWMNDERGAVAEAHQPHARGDVADRTHRGVAVEVPKDLLRLVEDVLLNRRPDATERLVTYAETVKQQGKAVAKDDAWRRLILICGYLLIVINIPLCLSIQRLGS
jgi:hypothetical protein